MKRPRHRRTYFVLGLVPCLLVATLASAGSQEKYDPYKVPRTQVVAQVLKIALQPIYLPPETVDAAAIRSRIERVVTESLEAGGFSVVPSGEYAATWRRLSEQVGGAYDPVTGVADTPKYNSLHDLAARDLAARLQTDATLYVGVDVGAMRFWGNPLAGISAPGGYLKWRGEWFHDIPQRINGTYLNALLTDNASVLLYSIRVPIEWTEIYAVRSHDARPSAELYGEEHLTAAVAQALGELYRNPRPTPTPEPLDQRTGRRRPTP